MSGVLEGKVALITGASQGGGKGAALQFAEEGADVALVSRSLPKLEAVAAEVEDKGVKALPLACDVTDVAQIHQVVEQTYNMLGGVDILVNAAQAPEMRSGPLLDIESEVMNLMWTSGPVATLEFMRASHSCLKQGGGVIINFCTGAMFKPQNNGVYAAVKSAIQMITRAAAMEWVDDGIRANAVVPLINSPVFEAYCEKDPAFVEQFVSTIPLKRMGDPESDIGRALVFLAGDDSRYITGSTIMMDGGHHFIR